MIIEYLLLICELCFNAENTIAPEVMGGNWRNTLGIGAISSGIGNRIEKGMEERMVDQNVLGILVFAAVSGFVFVALEATRHALLKGRAIFARDGQVRLA